MMKQKLETKKSISITRREDLNLIQNNLDRDLCSNLFEKLNITSKSRKHRQRRQEVIWDITYFIYKYGFKQMLSNGDNILEWALSQMNIEKWYVEQ